MKKRSSTAFLILVLLCLCNMKVNADHIHDWSDWEYYSKDNTNHYSIRYCYDCDQEEKLSQPHSLLSEPNYYDYGNKNTCYAYYTCKKCGDDIKKSVKHKFKYFKSDGTICYKCKNCDYVVGDTYIAIKYTVKATIKKGKTGVAEVPLLAKDKIKSYKIISGKKLIKIKRKSKAKLAVKAKKKGKAKFKVKTLSGAAYTFVVKIK